jgi:hypothetical protein
VLRNGVGINGFRPKSRQSHNVTYRLRRSTLWLNTTQAEGYFKELVQKYWAPESLNKDVLSTLHQGRSATHLRLKNIQSVLDLSHRVDHTNSKAKLESATGIQVVKISEAIGV